MTAKYSHADTVIGYLAIDSEQLATAPEHLFYVDVND